MIYQNSADRFENKITAEQLEIVDNLVDQFEEEEYTKEQIIEAIKDLDSRVQKEIMNIMF
jgi:hypothetical protein